MCNNNNDGGLGQKQLNRRQALKALMVGATVAASAVKSNASVTGGERKAKIDDLEFSEYLKKNYRLMTPKERNETVERLEQLYNLKNGVNIQVSNKDAEPGVLFGYAFNIGKCQGYMDCIQACVDENNQDRDTDIQYIRIFEKKNGQNSLESANSKYSHEVPAEGHFYMGTQCFQCENSPCSDVCPVGATWKEKDGIVVIDYDWCIGCRYCEAACPYFGRRFNWQEPKVPKDELNEKQHYLGNRMRRKGAMEKCTFCVQRSREGQQPACVEACPTGARVFGNLLDPQSEIRYVLENKKVFRLKEDLGTEPKFWYFMD